MTDGAPEKKAVPENAVVCTITAQQMSAKSHRVCMRSISSGGRALDF